jgi:hypothetical protein
LAPKNTLKLLAKQNWRGVATPDIVCQLQYTRDYLANFRKYPDSFIEAEVPDREEYIADTIFYHDCRIQELEKELERRRSLQYDTQHSVDNEIIQTIKAKIPIEDALGWYTEVLLHGPAWKYRCTLHGQDKHPSGHIYRDESRAWCFTCNRGGDIFDIVQLFERVALGQAISKLARYLGINTKALLPNQRKRGFDA